MCNLNTYNFDKKCEKTIDKKLNPNKYKKSEKKLKEKDIFKMKTNKMCPKNKGKKCKCK
tara:strand:+ start:1297 stop:1473 length:177 start_codon:yes stop_codon:yes gene_type:complete